MGMRMYKHRYTNIYTYMKLFSTNIDLFMNGNYRTSVMSCLSICIYICIYHYRLDQIPLNFMDKMKLFIQL